MTTRKARGFSVVIVSQQAAAERRAPRAMRSIDREPLQSASR